MSLTERACIVIEIEVVPVGTMFVGDYDMQKVSERIGGMSGAVYQMLHNEAQPELSPRVQVRAVRRGWTTVLER